MLLTLSAEKTSITHIKDGIDFLGWRIKRDLGRRGRPGIFLFPSLWAVLGKIKEITRSGTNQSLDQLLHRLNPVLRGWCNYFRSGQSSRTFQYLRHYSWRRVVRWLRRKYPKRSWGWLKRHHLPEWVPTGEETVLFNPAAVSTTRYRYRAARIETPWQDRRARTDRQSRTTARTDCQMTTGMHVESRMRGNSHVRFGGRRRANHRG